jgi:hypothetical protein
MYPGDNDIDPAGNLKRQLANRGGWAMTKFMIFSVICGMCATGVAHAAETTSLFFTPQEIAKIETTSASPDAPTDIHLGAVLYYGPSLWSIWLDGTKWTPDTRRADVQIIEVKPELVRLQLQNDPAQPIELKPYQTWQAASGMVVEGKH